MSVRYISTRGGPAVSFEEAVMAGLAPDGGLYLPERVPKLAPHAISAMAGMNYSELALAVMEPFVGEAAPQKDLKRLIDESYAGFRHSAVAPLSQLGHDEFLLELFHGPTLAFKDFALQFLGRLLEYFLNKRGAKLTVVGATSGDTGSAAIEGCKGRAGMRIFILHPKGRVSDVQRRQMTTVAEENVFNLAVEGSFDDCQAIVKTLFADEAFRKTQNLTAVNSINWARILAQAVYYFYAALALGAPARGLSFCVPTGNFGDIYAGHVARQMGLPIAKLIIATNENDILARTIQSGTYSKQGVKHSLSPSMDIEISSNFERLLFNLHDGKTDAVTALMRELKEKGEFTLAPSALAALRAQFAAASANDHETEATIASVYKATGQLIDPHTAVGVAAGRKVPVQGTLVTLATAHPAKFPDAVRRATGLTPALPAHLGELMTRDERMDVVANDANAVKRIIEKAYASRL